jgi:hypothetical protein
MRGCAPTISRLSDCLLQHAAVGKSARAKMQITSRLTPGAPISAGFLNLAVFPLGQSADALSFLRPTFEFCHKELLKFWVESGLVIEVPG